MKIGIFIDEGNLIVKLNAKTNVQILYLRLQFASMVNFCFSSNELVQSEQKYKFLLLEKTKKVIEVACQSFIRS